MFPQPKAAPALQRQSGHNRSTGDQTQLQRHYRHRRIPRKRGSPMVARPWTTRSRASCWTASPDSSAPARWPSTARSSAS
jgi:hypothetical protein